MECTRRLHREPVRGGGVHRGHRARAAQPCRAADLLAAVRRQRRSDNGLPGRRLQPAATRQRYLADIAAAGSGIESATARGGAGAGAAVSDLSELAQNLQTYTHEIETAPADNRLALPLGAAYLREATELMRGTLLRDAEDLYAAENASLTGASARATGLPLIASPWRRASSSAARSAGHRAGPRAAPTGCSTSAWPAGAVVVLPVGWLILAYVGARGDLLNAQARGLATVEAIAQVGIAAQEAHADESLTLIDNTGDDPYQADYVARQVRSAPAGHAAAAASIAAQGTPGGAGGGGGGSQRRADLVRGARAVRSLDDNGNHPMAVASVLGTAPSDEGAAFTRLSGDLTSAIACDQAVFDATAHTAAASVHRTGARRDRGGADHGGRLRLGPEPPHAEYR